MLKDLLKEGGLYTVANFVTKGVGLLLIPFYTAYFTPTDYGIIEILLVFGGLVNALVSFQIYQGVSRYLGESDLDQKEKSTIGSTAVFFVTATYLITCLGLIFFSDIFIDILSAEATIPKDIFILSMITVSVNAVFYSLGIQLRFLRKSMVFATSSFLHAIFTILLTIYFVLVKGEGISGIYWASIIVTPFIIAYQVYTLRGHLYFTFSFPWLKKLFIFSYPLIPAALAHLILNFTDRIYVKEILSFHELGLYAIASKFASIISILILGFSAALTPLIYESYQKAETRPQLVIFFKAFFAAGTIGILGLSVFSEEILILFTTPAYHEANLVMPIMFVSMFITGLNMFSPGLYIHKKTKRIGIIVVLSSLINIALNAVFIPKFGLYGAAGSTLIALGINNSLIYHLSGKEYPLGIKMKGLIIPSILFLLFIFIGNYILSDYITNIAVLYAIKASLIILYTLYLLQQKILNVTLIKKIFKKEQINN